MKVLIIEDEIHTANGLAKMLKSIEKDIEIHCCPVKNKKGLVG